MYYPVFLKLRGKKCLVVGAGRVALRKIIYLLRAGADVTVIAENVCNHFKKIEKFISFQRRNFVLEDISKEYFIVIGATNRREVNKNIYIRANELNIPCNIVDQPELCTFIAPSIVKRGKITIAISTDGISPRFTRYIKEKIAGFVEPAYEELLEYLGELRERIKEGLLTSNIRGRFWERLFFEDPVKKIKEIGWINFKEETEKLLLEFIEKEPMDEK